MPDGCNRQIHFTAVAAATVGELWFFYVYDNIKLNQRWTGLDRASRGGGRSRQWQSGMAVWGRQAISIKWLALKISGRTIKTPFRSGSVKQGGRVGECDRWAWLKRIVLTAIVVCVRLCVCVLGNTKSNNKPIKLLTTIKMAAQLFVAYFLGQAMHFRVA